MDNTLTKTTEQTGLKRFEKLVGTWMMTGRTLDATEDNISGFVTFRWMLDQAFLESKGSMRFKNFEMDSLEIIAFDDKTNNFPAYVFSDRGGVSVPYTWDIQGDTLIHSGSGSTYKGVFSEDGNTITGGWRSDNGQKPADGSSYDVVMTRVRDDQAKPRQ